MDWIDQEEVNKEQQQKEIELSLKKSVEWTKQESLQYEKYIGCYHDKIKKLIAEANERLKEANEEAMVSFGNHEVVITAKSVDKRNFTIRMYNYLGPKKMLHVRIDLEEYPGRGEMGSLVDINLAELRKDHIVAMIGILTEKLKLEYVSVPGNPNANHFVLRPHFKGLFRIRIGRIFFKIGIIFILFFLIYMLAYLFR